MKALQAEVRSLRALIAQLQEQLAAARKNSSTPSKPPSSDIVKPPPHPSPEEQSGRSIGGQPEHPRHERPLLPEALVNGGVHRHVPEICPDCGHGLQATNLEGRVVQQIDIQEIPLHVEEHHSMAGYCAQCGKLHYGALPSEIAKGGLVGPRLTALIAYLKGACHGSYSTIRKWLRDVVHVTVSRGLLAKVANAIAGPSERLQPRQLQNRVRWFSGPGASASGATAARRTRKKGWRAGCHRAGYAPRSTDKAFSMRAEEKRRQAGQAKQKPKRCRKSRRGRVTTADKFNQRTEKCFPEGLPHDIYHLSATRPVWRLEQGRAVLVAL